MPHASEIQLKDYADAFDIVARIWDRDYSIWPEADDDADNDWLGWLELPSKLSQGAGIASQRVVESLNWATSCTVLGMGGSSLTPETLASMFHQHAPRLHVLDTVNPRAVRNHLNRIELSTALFIIASKSGTTIEPLALERIFRKELMVAGISDASSRFIAISDSESPLAQRAAAGDFLHLIQTPSNVGGRYSALSAFGMFPASICGMPVAEMAERAADMAELCREKSLHNPGLALGSFMARNALAGRDKVTILTSSSLQRFEMWLEQLLAESTGKHGKGLIPVVGEPILPRACYGDDRQFIAISLGSEDEAEIDAFQDHPVFRISLPDRASIAAEFFRWEFATAVASSIIGVYPFDQPDVEAAKASAGAILASDETSNAINPSALGDAINRLLRKPASGRYIAIAAYMPEAIELTEAFSNLRRAITLGTGVATTFGYGPRYLHSTGQLHKGGPDSVMLIAVTQDDEEFDLEVPGANYSLAQLSLAQAAGDVKAMTDRGRYAELAATKQDPIQEIRQIASSI